LDYSIAVPVAILATPLLVLLAVLVKLDSPGPVLYRRRVLGLGGRSFDALRLRTMRTDGDEILARHPELQDELEREGKLRDDPRVTPLGKALRRSSLDELPQVFNVVLGQMSIVGPRMITADEQKRYGCWDLNLLTVKPGITGLWQTSGRSEVSYEERVQLDMNYIRNWTVWLDLHILLRTIPAVLQGRGAY
jgi:lipopolysaccharide/colanic/teichoic acid biosynthesis glycosyltransferase